MQTSMTLRHRIQHNFSNTINQYKSWFIGKTLS